MVPKFFLYESNYGKAKISCWNYWQIHPIASNTQKQRLVGEFGANIGRKGAILRTKVDFFLKFPERNVLDCS